MINGEWLCLTNRWNLNVRVACSRGRQGDVHRSLIRNYTRPDRHPRLRAELNRSRRPANDACLRREPTYVTRDYRAPNTMTDRLTSRLIPMITKSIYD